MTTGEILAGFGRLHALVVGDICLDRWCRYDPALAEPSRETGIPRVGVISVETTAGAGGTVANNLAALGAATVRVLGVIGADGHGFELRRALESRGIDGSLLMEAPGVQTFTYTKLLNCLSGGEDLPRIDFIQSQALASAISEELAARLDQAVENADVILVSDQAETGSGGAVSSLVRAGLARLARRHPRKVLWVDSRMRAELFRGVIVKPNAREAAEACARLGQTGAAWLREVIGSKPLVVTHGSEGAEIHDERGSRFVRTRKVEHPVDICGAGDSFSAGAALALAATGSIDEAVRIGNLAASVTIMKQGTGTASPDEVLGAE